MEKLLDAFQKKAVGNYKFQSVYSNNMKQKMFSKEKVGLELFLKMGCIISMYALAETHIVLVFLCIYSELSLIICYSI